MKLKPEIIAEFHKKFNEMPHRCSICGCEKFGYNDIEAQITSVDRIGSDLARNGPIESIPTITTYCVNCGHVDQFAIQVLLKDVSL